ncbi:two-component system QseEF-associated lipoprotein QseG [Pantoea sp. Mb-10]|uniref:two-component system QseEF-associated lipoprotein QseG n=1 Tax=unclassified Pantoea TaxID=2630326 RepID=UPI001E495285|nr:MULTISPECIES: two-component system QseEF-associated lipoprotein QseG [unclassified Pantoea]MCE0489164.1 two-component system QseEF-associated lipoprotein QseG [Pantoea sp. Mb-10]MCE0503087.1 two-component system QseEF-associated lipoprotein QseG [Pantoea sp. Pb-8]
MKRFATCVFAALMILGLSACQLSAPHSPSRDGMAIPEPDVRLADYLTVACANVWKTDSPAAMNNPLYWQRAMDCGEQLSAAEARAEARRWPVQGWARAFKQGILLSNGNVTPLERRQMLSTLDSYSSDWPVSVRPLLTLWQRHQTALLALSAERSRYAALQQASDAQLDSLRQQQTQLRQSLDDTQRKLERLTDIERQLSSRKTPDSSDTSHGNSDDQREDP